MYRGGGINSRQLAIPSKYKFTVDASGHILTCLSRTTEPQVELISKEEGDKVSRGDDLSLHGGDDADSEKEDQLSIRVGVHSALKLTFQNR